MEDTRPNPYPLRMPHSLKDEITEIAKRNNRSVHQEMIHALELHVINEQGKRLKQEINELKGMVIEIKEFMDIK